MAIRWSKKERDFFSEALEEFVYQITEDGYYDSNSDISWLGGEPNDTISMICERKWYPAGRHDVPSQLWDASTPTRGI